MTCPPVSDQLDEGNFTGESARTVNPVQTTAIFGGKRGYLDRDLITNDFRNGGTVYCGGPIFC